jgi:hypothetical protein
MKKMRYNVLPASLLLAKAQCKIGLRVTFLLAAALLAVFPLFFGVQYLNAVSAASFLERFVALAGIVLLVPIFAPEQDHNILDIVRARMLPQTCIILIRLALSLACLFALITILALIMKSGECTFPLWPFTAGTFITALTLGSVGFAGAGLTNNVVTGYCLSFLLWFANFTLRDKLGLWYLFSMTREDFRPKYVLLPSATLIIIATFLIRYVRKRLR